MDNPIVFIGVVFGLTVLFYICSKIKIPYQERQLSKFLTNLAVIILKNTDFKYKEIIEDICINIMTAISAVDDYYNCKTLDAKINIIGLNAVDICKKNGIDVDQEMHDAIMDLVEFLIINEIIVI